MATETFETSLESTAATTLPMAELQRLLDGLLDAAVLVNRDLRPLAWNRQFVQASGLRPRAFRARSMEPAIRCCDLLRLSICNEECLVKQAIRTGRPLRMDEIRSLGAEDAVPGNRLFIVSAIPLLDASGTAVAGVEMYREVTAEASVQARYKTLLERERHRAESLEEQVLARTSDLQASLVELERTRDQLIQSEKLSSLGTLVAGLAHELNNPINFVYGNVGFLEEYIAALVSVIDAYAVTQRTEEEAARVQAVIEAVDYDYVRKDLEKVLAAISTGIKRSAGIIQSLRTFIHPGGARASEVVDLRSLVAGTVALVKPEFRQRVQFELTCGEDLPIVRGSEARLNQVVMNLLMNAVQAISGEGSVVIGVRHEAREGRHGVSITVRDNGSGIKPEHLPHVFEPFFTTKPVGKGTGLGLSISYSIVQSHNGTISVESELGSGTVFRIWLPAEDRVVEPRGEEQALESVVAPLCVPKSPKKIVPGE